MSHKTMVHRTTTLERSFAASPQRLFHAWENPDIRRVWASPSDQVEIRNDAADFRVGGEDIQTCLVEGHPVATVHGRYHDIVPDVRIVYTEVISDDVQLQGMSLVSAEFIAEGAGTRLVVTLQTVAVDGSELLAEVEIGWTSALDSLGAMFVGA